MIIVTPAPESRLSFHSDESTYGFPYNDLNTLFLSITEQSIYQGQNGASVGSLCFRHQVGHGYL